MTNSVRNGSYQAMGRGQEIHGVRKQEHKVEVRRSRGGRPTEGEPQQETWWAWARYQSDSGHGGEVKNQNVCSNVINRSRFE